MALVDQAREVARKIFKEAGDFPLQVFVRIKKGLLARFANNGVHQNGFQDLFYYTLRASGKKDTIYLESNDPSEEAVRASLRRIRKRISNPIPFSLPKKMTYLEIKEHFPLHLEKIPSMAASTIEEGIRPIRNRQASANGYFSAYERLFYLADSSGLELAHPTTAVRFGVTVAKGAGKGYSSFYHPDSRKLKVSALVQEAIELAEKASQAEISFEPGTYECVFSPRAFLELIEPVRRHFDARLCRDGKSVFSGQLGKKIFSQNFTLHDNLKHPGQFGIPFDAEGASRKKAALVEKGLLKELLAEGHSTRGWLEHPFYPQNLVAEKGNLSLSELFKKIRRGIYINKIWYHTLIRESRMEVTGLATAGSLYIERGRIRGRVVHLRYHDSLFSILNSVAGATREQILLKDGEMGAALFPYLWVSRLKVV